MTLGVQIKLQVSEAGQVIPVDTPILERITFVSGPGGAEVKDDISGAEYQQLIRNSTINSGFRKPVFRLAATGTYVFQTETEYTIAAGEASNFSLATGDVEQLQTVTVTALGTDARNQLGSALQNGVRGLNTATVEGIAAAIKAALNGDARAIADASMTTLAQRIANETPSAQDLTPATIAALLAEDADLSAATITALANAIAAANQAARGTVFELSTASIQEIREAFKEEYTLNNLGVLTAPPQSAGNPQQVVMEDMNRRSVYITNTDLNQALYVSEDSANMTTGVRVFPNQTIEILCSCALWVSNTGGVTTSFSAAERRLMGT